MVTLLGMLLVVWIVSGVVFLGVAIIPALLGYHWLETDED